jgi:hypothetical protein
MVSSSIIAGPFTLTVVVAGVNPKFSNLLLVIITLVPRA